MGLELPLRALLPSAINSLNEYVATDLPFDAGALEEELLAAMPDEDCAPSFANAVAEDAAAAAVYALRTMRSGEPQNATWAARRAYETADRRVVAMLNVSELGPSEEDHVLKHAMVQTELRRQMRDLVELAQLGETEFGRACAIVNRARTESIFKY